MPVEGLLAVFQQAGYTADSLIEQERLYTLMDQLLVVASIILEGAVRQIGGSLTLVGSRLEHDWKLPSSSPVLGDR